MNPTLIARPSPITTSIQAPVSKPGLNGCIRSPGDWWRQLTVQHFHQQTVLERQTATGTGKYQVTDALGNVVRDEETGVGSCRRFLLSGRYGRRGLLKNTACRRHKLPRARCALRPVPLAGSQMHEPADRGDCRLDGFIPDLLVDRLSLLDIDNASQRKTFGHRFLGGPGNRRLLSRHV